jgi:hypothetical protein
MKEAANRAALAITVRGAVPSPPATPKISHLYKSGDTYDNFLRLVRPTDPC